MNTRKQSRPAVALTLGIAALVSLIMVASYGLGQDRAS